MPQLVQKFYAIRDERAVRRGMIASTAFALLIAGAAYFTGAAARLFLTPENAPGGLRRRQARFRRPDARVPGQGRPAVALRADDAPHPVGLHVDLGRPGPHLELLGRQGPLRRFRQPGRHRPGADAADARSSRPPSSSSPSSWPISVRRRIVAILSVSWGAIGSFFLGPFVWGLISRKVTKFGAIGSAVLGLGTCLGLSLSGLAPAEAGSIGMIVSFASNPC
ncbi:MAG: hypothetical protein MZV64_63535 [Ignavibacteriales bacterium]|nr:hypothetical protein [Ignavibacteriales bacterium]